MSGVLPWHEDDAFWEAMAPVFFDEEHWAAAPAEVDGALALLGLEPGDSVLDLCCGPGRHSLELARRGFHVTGVDRTAAYLKEARRRAERENLSVEFVRDDMRLFSRPDAFEGAVNLSTSFGYFESEADDRRVLLNLHRSLKDGGALVMEMLGEETVAREFRPTERYLVDGGTVIVEDRHIEERRITGGGTWFEKERRIVIDGEVRREFNVSHRLYSPSSLSALLEECGFRQVRTYGNLAGDPYDENAERLVAVARV